MARQGAPEGLNYDTWSEIALGAERIRVRATGENPDMPPVSGAAREDVDRLALWLDCGAQGTDPEPGPCDTLTWVDGGTVSNQGEADALCAQGNAVRGDLIVDDVHLDCLCEVDGELATDGASYALLGHIRGDLSVVAGSPELPLLQHIDGSLVADNSGATAIRLPELQTVGGDVWVTASKSIGSLEVPHLLTVGGALQISDTPVAHVDLSRLRSVGDALVLQELQFLTDLTGLGAVEFVGADVQIQGTGLTNLDTFRLLTASGPIAITGNAALRSIDGFTSLPVASRVQVTDNDVLYELDGFDNVLTLESLEVTDNLLLQRVFGFVNLTSADRIAVANNPALNSLQGLSALTTVGDFGIANGKVIDLPWFARLEQVTDRLEIAELPSLTQLTSFVNTANIDALTVRNCPRLARLEGSGTLTAMGPLALVDLPLLQAIPLLSGVQSVESFRIENTGLPDLQGFQMLQHVESDLAIIGNFDFTDDDANLFVLQLQVDGDVEVRDNAP